MADKKEVLQNKVDESAPKFQGPLLKSAKPQQIDPPSQNNKQTRTDLHHHIPISHQQTTFPSTNVDLEPSQDVAEIAEEEVDGKTDSSEDKDTLETRNVKTGGTFGLDLGSRFRNGVSRNATGTFHCLLAILLLLIPSP